MATNTGQIEQLSPRYTSSRTSSEDSQIQLPVLEVFTAVAVYGLLALYIHTKS